MHDLFKGLFDWYNQSLATGGYPLIVLLMAIESSIIPLPSELIIPPAIIAAQKSGNMTFTGIVIAGALGPRIGATVMCTGLLLPPVRAESRHGRGARRRRVEVLQWRLMEQMGFRRAGRPFLQWVASHLLVTPEKIGKAERWSAHYGSFGIFASRLLPVVRHLIGIPAGIVRLNYVKFSIFTIIGSAVWCTVLCWVVLASRPARMPRALMNGELHRITIWAVGALAVLGVIYYFFVHRFTREPAE